MSIYKKKRLANIARCATTRNKTQHFVPRVFPIPRVPISHLVNKSFTSQPRWRSSAGDDVIAVPWLVCQSARKRNEIFWSALTEEFSEAPPGHHVVLTRPPANIVHQMRRKALDCSTLLEQRTVSDDRQSKVWPIDPATLTEKSEEANHRSTNDWTEWSILWFRSSFIFTPFPTPRPPRNHHPPPLRYQFTRTLLMVVLRISKHFFLSAPCTS